MTHLDDQTASKPPAQASRRRKGLLWELKEMEPGSERRTKRPSIPMSTLRHGRPTIHVHALASRIGIVLLPIRACSASS